MNNDSIFWDSPYRRGYYRPSSSPLHSVNDDVFFDFPPSHGGSDYYSSHFPSLPSARRFPVRQKKSPPAPNSVSIPFNQTEPAPPVQKVVSVPVKFMNVERNEVESAVKIQKVLRGFLVRKSVKKIAAIRKEVEEIEERICVRENVEVIRRDSTERLRVNEMLMSLLLKLDSIRGFDRGVRDCRKAVIKKAIALQDKIDAIVASDVTLAEPTDEVVQASDPEENLEHNQENTEASLEDIAEQIDEVVEASDPEEKNLEHSNGDGNIGDEAADSVEEKDSVGTSPTESETDSSANPLPPAEEPNEEEIEILQTACAGVEGKEEKDKSKELLEKMTRDNEKMMELMAQLFERNEMQTRLLSSLSQRVEQLERAFVCDRLRKKLKKKNGVVGCREPKQDCNNNKQL